MNVPEADGGLPLSIVRRTLRVIRPPRLISFHNIKAFNPDAPPAGVDNNLDTSAPSTPVDLASPENRTPSAAFLILSLLSQPVLFAFLLFPSQTR